MKRVPSGGNQEEEETARTFDCRRTKEKSPGKGGAVKDTKWIEEGDVWETAQHCPLFSLLKDSECYVFQCINLTTAEREELVDEERRLCDVRPFQAFLRLVEKKGDKQEKIINSRLRSVIGPGLRESTELKIPEVSDFRRQMKLFCEAVCGEMEQDSWEQRVLHQYPVAIESSPQLPSYLHSKLHDGNLVISISVENQCSVKQSSTFKFSVHPSINAKELLDLVLSKKGPSIGLQSHLAKNYVLKICGLEEYLVGPHPLSQFKYVQETLSNDKTPELVLVPSDTILLDEDCIWNKQLERQRSRSLTSESGTLLKRKKATTVSAWSIDEPLSLTVHFAQRLNHDSKVKVAVQCGIFYSDEILCDVCHTSEKCLEDNQCTWEETVHFNLNVNNLPRMAKLCLCLYELSPTQKNSRFRKCEGGYACPLVWVNTPVFDYKGILKSLPSTLSTWPYTQEVDDYSTMMLRPLGWTTANPVKDQAAEVTVSFCKYHPTAQVAYPSFEEILEYAVKDSNDNNNSSFGSVTPQVSKCYLESLREICEKDTLYQLHEQEKELMWFLRADCRTQLHHSLPKLLRCIKWNDRREIAQMMMLLQDWPLLSPHKALELLDYAYPDPKVRSFAVRCLQVISDEELTMYMLQLVQALKHESYLQNDLVKFLLERSLKNRHMGHRLFWLLKSDIDFPEVTIRFALILEVYCRSVPVHLEALEKQVQALRKFKMANNLIQNEINLRKEGKEKLKVLIQDLLERTIHETLIKGLQNPLDPRLKFGRIRVEKCKFLDSKLKPLWLAFENTDTCGKDLFLIFKNGDDLRQDMLTLQMIRIMDKLWKDEGLDLRMIPYQCLATGHKMGLIEVVPDANTIANIQKEKGFTATSAFKKGSLLAWLKDHNPDENSLSKAAEEFTLSCAGYCVATYVLGVADRHSDNIMVKTNGQLFHVDFGHILGKFKEKFGFKRERVPFVLTHDFVYIITKGHTQRSQEFTRFQEYCEKAFMILRRKGPLVISLFAMMLSTGIPELSSEKDLDYLRETLVLDMTENEAVKHFRSKFDEALKNSWKTSVNWMAHNWARDNN
ncbi:phosphatidylinositol 4,5-bisphosphate 3-kinase catalytic subunit delta isoform-like [Stegodyphus dumicola]|uniref:phosphatidylinositol 4,5-bisphosphate 3-kinase catalytic subunit delta isoform-like n=1 Tax=Stegodyphus dumicola TaxID=202533 RepID=UPI0015AE803F|nr:phosphatidylinositol 4,5-bisphosphate 3-kinase catalytic subunit delta isoform-like [Stegodyphus dumicola]